MPTLLLMRHAKSSWKDAGLDDHDRPLNKRGRRVAPRMGAWLRDEALLPDHVVTSSAVRALDTAHAVVDAAGFAGVLDVEPELYLADVADQLEILAAVPATAQRVLLVGHNPGLERLIEHLTGATERMPTAAVAWIDLDVATWADVGPGTRGRLVGVHRPRAT